MGAQLYEHSLMRIPVLATDGSVELEDGASLFDILKQNRDRPFEGVDHGLCGWPGPPSGAGARAR